ncbi:MAG: DnaD domain protein [Clostridia bacterium]|nr:DnaD domain protein [Clostridia bacterium]
MVLVNYVMEAEAFIEYAAMNGLTDHERALWYALFHLMNREAKGPWWPDGFISVRNKILLPLVGFSEDMLPSVRNRLVQRSLIDYVPGKRNARHPAYLMHYFYPQNVDNSCGKPCGKLDAPDCDISEQGFYPEDAGKNAGKTIGKTIGKSIGKSIGHRINNTETETEQNLPDEEATDCISIQGGGGGPVAVTGRMRLIGPQDSWVLMRLRRMLKAQWFADVFGKRDMDVMEALIERDTYPLELVHIAIQLTVSRHEKNPLHCPAAYTVHLLDDWRSRGIRTANELQRYQRGYYADLDSRREENELSAIEG